MAKSFWKSKTFWFGALYIITGIAGLFGYADYVPDATVDQLALIVTGIVTVLLRFVTKEPVSL